MRPGKFLLDMALMIFTIALAILKVAVTAFFMLYFDLFSPKEGLTMSRHATPLERERNCEIGGRERRGT